MPFTDEELARMAQAEENQMANATRRPPDDVSGWSMPLQPPAQPAPPRENDDEVAEEEAPAQVPREGINGDGGTEGPPNEELERSR